MFNIFSFISKVGYKSINIKHKSDYLINKFKSYCYLKNNNNFQTQCRLGALLPNLFWLVSTYNILNQTKRLNIYNILNLQYTLLFSIK